MCEVTIQLVILVYYAQILKLKGPVFYIEMYSSAYSSSFLFIRSLSLSRSHYSKCCCKAQSTMASEEFIVLINLK